MADEVLAVFIASRDSNQCKQCGSSIRKGGFLVPAGKECQYLNGAGFDHLATDAALKCRKTRGTFINRRTSPKQ